MRDRSLGFLVLGGGVAAAGALLWRRKRATVPTVDAIEPLLVGWTVPVPTLVDRPAVVSNEFRAVNPRQHLGVDLMFRRRDSRDLFAVYPPKTANGTALFFMPEGISALAAAPGTVSFADMTGMGNSVIIQHAIGWATYYTHLSSLAVKRGDVVHAGQVLGTIGANPLDGEHLKHLHFEMWKGGKRTGAVDPAPYLAMWRRVTSPWSPSLVASASPAPRNGSTSAYRQLGERGEPYPDWVRALKGKAGVYIIRDADSHECLYVGSSAGRLYDTLTRHFQTWRRFKGFWRGQYAEGADPGLTYPRADVEVAVRLTSPGAALDEEMRTIARLRPRDNQIGQPDTAADETVPF
ncbi:MAG: M23 family metallopeptidase [Kofleriaceae bacterium]